ncbi:sodium/proton antiporter, CPA1 family [Chitinophaga costaii]|uniref:Sodium/proton antiporter, CPA1 family n=1 Tax=Chitinophaga costaii TaxID=1335309 RepID=A0A1C4CWX5_9BACT|nr:Na+/H+ antiporter [Chitinophaga costaii]PUZ26910.1 Na+/H+ antiporter [Chitinophaga costaii]SCC23542.1 sodium/proton antiporter, CPA1 family [Chitinophaga costaii]
MLEMTPIIFIVVALAILSVVAGHIKKISYPILLVLGGLVLGFIPGLPVIDFNPNIIFLLVLPPLLFRAGWDTSWPDFKASLRPITRLAIGLVLVTAVAVAFAAHYFLPGVSWPVAFVLGAIVSPPDAVSASSIVKGMGLNKRLVTILEGESLVNDASALVIYRHALAAVVTTGFVLWKAGLQFVLVTLGGILVGLATGYAFAFILKNIRKNPMVESILSLICPFIAYPVAEKIGCSGVLAVVSAGLVISWMSSKIFSYQGRTQTNSLWDVIGFLLNGIIFILIGIQLSQIAAGLPGFRIGELIRYGLFISAVTIVARMLFIAPALFMPSLLASPLHQQEQVFTWKNVIILSWSGMRGVVSLATAMALPVLMDNGLPFPNRSMLIFITFVVIVVTLVGQGLTLPLLIKWLKIDTGANTQEEEKKLRLLINTSALDYINQQLPAKGFDNAVLDQVRKLYELRIYWLHDPTDKGEGTAADFNSFLSQVAHAQLDVTVYKREILSTLYREGKFPADQVLKLEREMDFDESRLHSQLSGQEMEEE